MTAKRIGMTACVFAVLLLGMALVTGSMARSAGRAIGVTVTDASVRLVMPGRPAAGFLTIMGGSTPDLLLDASSPRANRIELHQVRKDGMVMRMVKLPSIAVPAQTRLSFESEGYHLMIFGASLKQGDKVPLTLHFEKTGLVKVTAIAHEVAHNH